MVSINRNQKNENAKNIEKIAIHDVYTVADKVKEIFREFFWLFEDRNVELIPCFQDVLKLGGGIRKSRQKISFYKPSV